MNAVRAVVLGAALLASGCFGTEVTEFPEGLEPLGDVMIEGPGTPEDPYPEEFIIEGMDGSRFSTITGHGYILAPPSVVWAAYRNPAVGADRRTSPEWTSEPVSVEGTPYDDSYVVYHVAHDIVTVEWWVTWRHGLIEGTQESPELVSIRWQKTEGSTLISRIEGSLILEPAGDGSVTEISLVYHASAAGSGTDTYVRYMQDVYNDARALSHDEPLPTFD